MPNCAFYTQLDIVSVSSLLLPHKQACCAGCRRRHDANPLIIGKMRPFNKIAVTFEPVMQFWCPSRLSISQNYGWKHHLKPLGRGRAIKIFSQMITQLSNKLINEWRKCLERSPWLRPVLLKIRYGSSKVPNQSSWGAQWVKKGAQSDKKS